MVIPRQRSRAQPARLGGAVRRGLAVSAWRATTAVLALALAVWLSGSWAMPESAPSAGEERTGPADRPAVPAAARLTARHDCWTSGRDAPVDLPGHVVVTPPGGHPIYSRRWTGPALEQVFGEADHHLTVHGFCR